MLPAARSKVWRSSRVLSAFFPSVRSDHHQLRRGAELDDTLGRRERRCLRRCYQQPAQKCGDRRAYYLHSSPRSDRTTTNCVVAPNLTTPLGAASGGVCADATSSPLKSVAIVARIICILPLGPIGPPPTASWRRT